MARTQMNPILCPLRNNFHFIRKALPTFLAQDIGDVSVLLLDNASDDGTSQWANALKDDRVVYIHNAKPLSVAASWNRMLYWTFKAVPYALVVNADVELRPDTYRHLVADGGLFVTAVGSADRSKINPPFGVPDPAKKRPHPDFSCYLIRKECWDRVGKFDECFEGAYHEDGSYHLRLHRAGIEALCLDLPFYHVGAGTLKNAGPLEARAIRDRSDRNRALFRQMYGVEMGTPEYYELFGQGAPE